MPLRFSLDETFDVGEDTGTPVNLNYDVPFKFTGQIEKVVINLGQTKLGAADQQKLKDVGGKTRGGLRNGFSIRTGGKDKPLSPCPID